LSCRGRMPAVHDQKRVGALPPPCAVINNGANWYSVCTFRLEDAIKRTLPVRQRRSCTTISVPGSSSHTSLNSSAIARRFSLGSRPVSITLYCNSISGRFSPGDAAVTKLGELVAGCGFRFPRILDLSSAPKTTTARVLWRLCDLCKHVPQGRVWLVLTPAFAEWALRRLFGFQLSSMNARAPPPQPFLSKFGYFLVTLLILLRNPNRRKKTHQLAFLGDSICSYQGAGGDGVSRPLVGQAPIDKTRLRF
jgi:hypothetical protein